MAVVLSQLKGFKKQKLKEEQYPTEPEIAAEVLWLMFLRREIEGKAIADLGSGTGILGLGALLLGAKKVFLVEKDKDAMKIAKENHEWLKEQGFETNEAVVRTVSGNGHSGNCFVVGEVKYDITFANFSHIGIYVASAF